MRYQFVTADVFTTRRFGGNPLAVIPDARGLDSDLMETVAREFNLSETVFIFPPDDPAHTRRLRIFTPAVELPFAGHPTIGAAWVLASSGAIPLSQEQTHIVFEENIGPVPVTITSSEGHPVRATLTAAIPPRDGPSPPDRAVLARLLSLEEEDLLEGAYKPEALSCGVPFLYVPVRDRDALGRARVQQQLWEETLANYWAPHLYLLTLDAELPGSDLRARMFAPAMGIQEDPATGAAATALAGYLAKRSDTRNGTLHWKVEQGWEMGRPSEIEVEADLRGGVVERIRVGGAAVLVAEGWIEV